MFYLCLYLMFSSERGLFLGIHYSSIAPPYRAAGPWHAGCSTATGRLIKGQQAKHCIYIKGEVSFGYQQIENKFGEQACGNAVYQKHDPTAKSINTTQIYYLC